MSDEAKKVVPIQAKREPDWAEKQAAVLVRTVDSSLADWRQPGLRDAIAEALWNAYERGKTEAERDLLLRLIRGEP